MDSWEMLEQMRHTLNEEDYRRIQRYETENKRHRTILLVTTILAILSFVLLFWSLS